MQRYRQKKKNTINKQNLEVSYQVYTILGLLWIFGLIFIFVRTNIIDIIMNILLGARHCDESCTATSLTRFIISLLMFSVGSAAVAYGVQQPSTTSRRKLSISMLYFTFIISVASMVVYGWINLFTNGLYH